MTYNRITSRHIGGVVIQAETIHGDISLPPTTAPAPAPQPPRENTPATSPVEYAEEVAA